MSIKHAVKVFTNLILLIVLCAGFVACGTTQPEPTVTPIPVESPSSTVSPMLVGLTPFSAVTPTPLPPDYPTPIAQMLTVMPTLTPSATSTLDPHQCTFPLAQTTTAESTPENYTFSEPKIVLTGDEYPPDIAGWLPDNQNAIIMPVKAHRFDGIDGYLQTIELFNPETRETHVYATRRTFGEELLAWNSALNAIIYPAPNVLGEDKATKQLTFTYQIRISYGNQDKTQLLMDDLPRYDVTVKPDGSQVVYLKNNDKQNYQLYSRKFSQGTLQTEQSIPFDTEIFGHGPAMYDMTWRPGTSQLFVYSYVSSTNQTFLLDVNTGRSCVLYFDEWVYFARWSPNGRYLAVTTQQNSMLSLWADLDLNVLDTVSGKLYKIDSAKIVPPNRRHVVSDFSWAPDNHHLAIIGEANAVSTSPPPTIGRLYLVDFLSGDVDNLFPSYQFYAGWWGASVAWSPDGSKIMAKCSPENELRLCLVPVQRAIQP